MLMNRPLLLALIKLQTNPSTKTKKMCDKLKRKFYYLLQHQRWIIQYWISKNPNEKPQNVNHYVYLCRVPGIGCQFPNR